MRRETRQLMLPVSCEAAYDFLLDYHNDMLWRPELKSVELKSGAVGEPGAVYDACLDWHGMEVPHTLGLVACKRPCRVHIRTDSPGMSIDVVYNLYDKDSQCFMTADYVLSMEGPMMILEPFGWGLLMGWVNDDLPNLPEVLAASVPK